MRDFQPKIGSQITRMTTATNPSTLCLKNATSLSCYNFDPHELILTIFGINVTENVGTQKVFYFPTSPN